MSEQPIKQKSFIHLGLHNLVILNVWMRRLFDYSFIGFIVITVLLPNGSVMGLNIKLPIYAGLLPIGIYFTIRRKAVFLNAILVSSIPIVFTLWIPIGASYGFSFAGALRQYGDIALAFVVCWLADVFSRDSEAGRLRFLRLVIYAASLAAFSKVLIVGCAFVLGIPVYAIVDRIAILFGFNLMTTDFGALFGRVQFLSDVVVPLPLFVLLRYRERLGINIAFAASLVPLLTISMLLSFSRYFWGFSSLAIILGLVLGKRDRLQGILIAMAGIIVLLSLPNLLTLYHIRFSEEGTTGSDAPRNDQSRALEKLFLQSPFFGNGLGSYSREFLRTPEPESHRYGYEMQLLAFTAQVGVVGIALSLCLLGWYYRRLFTEKYASVPDRLALITLLIFWLMSGVYNPLLLNGLGGITFATLAAATGVRSNNRVGRSLLADLRVQRTAQTKGADYDVSNAGKKS